MSLVRVLWKGYRLVVFPVLHALSGGGTHSGCRHQPSCSVYAVQVIELNGWVRGGWSAFKRVLSCHPWNS